MRHASTKIIAFIIFMIAILAAFSVGCSGNGNPASPAIQGDVSQDLTGQPDRNFQSTGSNSTLLGFWEVSIDPDTLDVDIVPLRGALFTANITRILQPPATPVNYFTVYLNLGFCNIPGGYLDLDITVQHPLSSLAVFRAFDMRGIIMGDGEVPFSFDDTVFRGGPDDFQVLNADGYARWWNPTEFTTYDVLFGYTKGNLAPSGYHASATINPYKYFADGLEEKTPLSELDLTNRGTFSTQQGYLKRNYQMQFPVLPGGGPVYKFNYAVDTNWAAPDPMYDPIYPVEAFPPEANLQEAWWTTADSSESTAWFVNEDANGGLVHLNVEVYDWQGAWQENGVADEVSKIWLDSPVFDGPVDMVPISTVNPGGQASSVWSADIQNLNLTGSGEFELWIAVEASHPENYAPQVPGNPNQWDWPDAPLRAYFKDSIMISGEFPTGPPQVDSVFPDEGIISTVIPDLQIAGANFQDGAEVEFTSDLGDSLTLSGVMWENSGLITCDLITDGPLGFYDVLVRNPDTQEGTLNDGFEVILADLPEIFEVLPSQGIISTIVPDLAILGANFQDGLTVAFTTDPDIELTIENLDVVADDVITMDLHCDGPLGFYDVHVINPDMQEAVLPAGFEIYQETAQIWWQSHMYNTQNIGRNPTVPGADPETLTQVWSTPVGGDKKYTTPVVADYRVFFTGNNGFYGNTSMTMHCFDLVSGESLWSNPINPTNVTAYRAFACPVYYKTPDGTQRVAVGGDQVYCYDAVTGEELWTFDDSPGGVDMNWISNQMQEYNGMVLAKSRSNHFYVLDFESGDMIHDVVISSSGEGGCGAKDGLAYISCNKNVDCVDLTTGEVVWSTPLPYDAAISHWINPAIVSDRLYVSTYQGYVFAIAIAGNTSHTPGEIIWSWNDPAITPGSNPLVGGCSVSGNKVFAAAAFSGNYVYCIIDEGETASTGWKSSTTGYFDASPVWSTAPSYPEGVVYCPDRGGFIRAYDASNGQEVWAYSTGGELRAGMSPIVDILVVTSGTDVSVFKGP